MKPEPLIGKSADFLIGVALAAIFLPVFYGLLAAGLVERVGHLYDVFPGLLFPWNDLVTFLTVELIYFAVGSVLLRRVKLIRRGALIGGLAILLFVAAILLSMASRK